jgi:hypothetical protein
VTSRACPRGLCTTHQDGPCPALGRTPLPATPNNSQDSLPTTLGTHSRQLSGLTPNNSWDSLPATPALPRPHSSHHHTPATISLQPPQPLLTLLDTFPRLPDLSRSDSRLIMDSSDTPLLSVGLGSNPLPCPGVITSLVFLFSFTHVCLVPPPVLPRSYSPFAYGLLCLCATLLISVVTPHRLSFSPNPVLSLVLRIL